MNEIELSDRADVFAERGPAEEAVDHKRGDEVGDGDPGRDPRAVPEGKRFVAPEKEHHQHHGEPLAAQPARPRPPARQPAAGQRPWQREGAGHAEEVPRHQQRKDQQSAPVNPRQDSGEVHRGKLRAAEAVENDDRRQRGERELQEPAGMSPTQEAAYDRRGQQVETATDAGPPRRTAANPRIAVGAEQIADADPEHRQQERDRAGHPHQHAGSLLIVERRKPVEPRHVRIVRIQHARREREPGREQRVLHVGQQQIGKHEPLGPTGPAGVRPDDRIPKEQGGADETGVFDKVPAIVHQAQLIAARHVPKPGCRHVERPGHEWVSQKRKRRGASGVIATAARSNTFAPAPATREPVEIAANQAKPAAVRASSTTDAAPCGPITAATRTARWARRVRYRWSPEQLWNAIRRAAVQRSGSRRLSLRQPIA